MATGQTFDAPSVLLFVRDPADPRCGRVRGGIGLPDGLLDAVLGSDEGLLGHVLLTGNAIAVAHQALPTPVRHPFGPATPAVLATPVRVGDEVVGALAVGRADQFAPSERHLLTPFAASAAALLRDAAAPSAADPRPTARPDGRACRG